MPVYEYKALDKKGKKVNGFLDAGDAKRATQELRGRGIFPVSLAEVAANGRGRSQRRPSLFTPRINAGEVAVMTRQLSTLVSSGFPLIAALNTLVPQIKKPALKRIISRIKDSIEEGSDFARALEAAPGVFSPIYINMVRAGEASGTLGIVLERLAEILENQNKMAHKIRAALAYPLLMAIIGTGVLVFLLTVIVPNITSIFREMNQALPLSTQILIDASGALKQWGWTLVPLGGAAAVVTSLALKQPWIRYRVDGWVLALPLFGELKLKIITARFARTLGSLLENGVILLDALTIAGKIAGNKVMEEGIRAAAQGVEKGRELGAVLGEGGQLPYLAVQMIKVGEQTGDLESMLKKTAGVYEEEVETSLMGLTSLMEPLIILAMALVVGFIVLSICLPIFEMNQLVN